jgi:hypothetical protein
VTTLTRRFLGGLSLAVLTVIGAGCGSDETQATDDHTPVSYSVLINNIGASAPYTFTLGQTVVVRLKLFNAAQEDLDDVEAEHFAGLTFNPADLVTITRVPGHNYQFSVTGNTAGTGTMQVSFGHDEQADETTLPPAAVSVVGTGGPN